MAYQPQDEIESSVVLHEPKNIQDFIALGAAFAAAEREIRRQDMILNRRIAKLKSDHAVATMEHIRLRDKFGDFIMLHVYKNMELVFGGKASAELGPIKVTDYVDKRKTFSPGNLDDLAAELRAIPELSDLVVEKTEVIVSISVDLEALKLRLIDNPELLEKVSAIITTKNKFKIELPLNERESRDKVKSTPWERRRPD